MKSWYNALIGTVLVIAGVSLMIPTYNDRAGTSQDDQYTWYVSDVLTEKNYELYSAPEHVHDNTVRFTMPESGDTIELHGAFRIYKLRNR